MIFVSHDHSTDYNFYKQYNYFNFGHIRATTLSKSCRPSFDNVRGCREIAISNHTDSMASELLTIRKLECLKNAFQPNPLGWGPTLQAAFMMQQYPSNTILQQQYSAHNHGNAFPMHSGAFASNYPIRSSVQCARNHNSGANKKSTEHEPEQ